ncbi:MAG: helix-turn-helix domain-containing protein [Chlorobi bacterium]|nr:helix-turn-helix domain-containing protein [Chlorobiota bacterium]MBX7217100.1 helix-turn-helix domain-containing protein [Candidatus Kapabacteria bacterium]
MKIFFEETGEMKKIFLLCLGNPLLLLPDSQLTNLRIMARHRTGKISESVYLLRQMEERHRGQPAEERVRALRMLKEDPNLSVQQLAVEMDCSERTIRRWWALYQKGGLEAVVQEKVKSTAVVAKLGDEKVAELGQKLARRELTSLAEVQGWLKSECNLDYSIPGVWHLVRRTFKVERSWAPRTDAHGWQGGGADGLVPAKIVRFLNSLPLLGETRDRILIFRSALQELFPEIDRVVINVNTSFDLQNPETYSGGVSITQAINVEEQRTGVVVTSFSSDDNVEQLIQAMRGQGYPLDDFHAPSYINFSFGNDGYIGTIFLFRVIEKPAISSETLSVFASLDSFFQFMLFDLVAHHRATKPVDVAFSAALKQLSVESKLTLQERKVVIHQLLGGSYKEIADLLDISVATLKKHITSIHTKTGTRSQGELFAKYFTPRLTPVLTMLNETL